MPTLGFLSHNLFERGNDSVTRLKISRLVAIFSTAAVAKSRFLETLQRLEQIHKKVRTDWTAANFRFPAIYL